MQPFALANSLGEVWANAGDATIANITAPADNPENEILDIEKHSWVIYIYMGLKSIDYQPTGQPTQPVKLTAGKSA